MKPLAVTALLLLPLAGCVTAPYTPQGPTVAVMPKQGKSYEAFMREDQQCRGYAAASAGNTPAQPDPAGNVVAGAAIGAAAGVLLGRGPEAAGVGAGLGALAGAASANDQAYRSGNNAQQRYNLTYQQCMYAKGNQLQNSDSPSQPRSSYRYPPRRWHDDDFYLPPRW